MFLKIIPLFCIFFIGVSFAMEKNIKKIYPPKLSPGDTVAVIAPSLSGSIIAPDVRAIANQRFKKMGLKLVFGKHIEECDAFSSSSIQSRIEDLHWAFQDPTIKGIFTMIGGFNSNQLLPYIDWDLISKNPKVFYGYSDITALQNAILAKTGLVTYSGPHYSTFGQELYFDYIWDYCEKCLFLNDPIEILPSHAWSDDFWYLDQKDRIEIPNKGFYVINEGEASGTIIGGNLITLKMLQGTEYFPNFNNTILFLEDDYESLPHHFDRNLQSLISASNFKEVKALVLGRFQNKSLMTKEKLQKIIASKKELQNIPIIADVDFGHTSPIITFPIGGQAYLRATKSEIKLVIEKF